MIWSSGVVATYGEQSAYVRNGLLNKDLQPTTPLYIASDIAASIARAPQTWINETSRFIDSVVLSDPKEYSLDNDGISWTGQTAITKANAGKPKMEWESGSAFLSGAPAPRRILITARRSISNESWNWSASA